MSELPAWFLPMVERVTLEHNERTERWAKGVVTLSEVVEQMSCPACEAGIDYDGKECVFCKGGLTMFPAAAKALQYLAQREQALLRLADELLKPKRTRKRCV